MKTLLNIFLTVKMELPIVWAPRKKIVVHSKAFIKIIGFEIDSQVCQKFRSDYYWDNKKKKKKSILMFLLILVIVSQGCI